MSNGPESQNSPVFDPHSSIPELRWSKRLYAQDPWKRWIVVAAAILAAALGYAVMRHPIFSFLGLVAVLASTAEFWAPLNYKLDEKRASVRCGISVTAIEWADVRRIITSEDAIKVSPLEKSGRTSPFRGVTLRLEGNRDEVLRFIEEHKPENARVVEYGVDGGADQEPASVGGGTD